MSWEILILNIIVVILGAVSVILHKKPVWYILLLLQGLILVILFFLTSPSLLIPSLFILLAFFSLVTLGFLSFLPSDNRITPPSITSKESIYWVIIKIITGVLISIALFRFLHGLSLATHVNKILPGKESLAQSLKSFILAYPGEYIFVFILFLLGSILLSKIWSRNEN